MRGERVEMSSIFLVKRLGLVTDQAEVDFIEGDACGRYCRKPCTFFFVFPLQILQHAEQMAPFSQQRIAGGSLSDKFTSQPTKLETKTDYEVRRVECTRKKKTLFFVNGHGRKGKKSVGG